MKGSTHFPVVKSTPNTIGALLEGFCTNAQQHTTIIACCRRSRFFEQLALHALPSTEVLEEPGFQQPRPDMDGPPVGDAEEPVASSKHASPPLLQPTLRLLATSLNTNIVFCSSIPSFRAYVSTLPLRSTGSPNTLSQVIIVDMLALHHGTSEFTIQGLSRTFAMLASVNNQLGGEMQLVECNDFHDPIDPQRGSRLWGAEVPLLSGSVKIGEAGQGWASRTTSIRSFAERWFQFE
ncbi:hypothetical protein PMZ80_008481 [Knufia obscura]|uniref:Uncharacterized protein n=1 Tax=Knufia obscura TaxID=1635080 RepID=A0ABR0REY3_9EURO|nr:hypothetical protein PMZ80_008481 [Knufia obscura]